MPWFDIQEMRNKQSEKCAKPSAFQTKQKESFLKSMILKLAIQKNALSCNNYSVHSTRWMAFKSPTAHPETHPTLNSVQAIKPVTLTNQVGIDNLQLFAQTILWTDLSVFPSITRWRWSYYWLTGWVKNVRRVTQSDRSLKNKFSHHHLHHGWMVLTYCS